MSFCLQSLFGQQSLKDLGKAYKNFFNGSEFPKFKSKHDHFYSYCTQMVNNNIKVEGIRISLPKLGSVKFKKSEEVEGKIQNVTVSQTNTGKYFVSICCETVIQQKPKAIGKVGIDVGISTFCAMSNGIKMDNSKYLESLKTTKEGTTTVGF